MRTSFKTPKQNTTEREIKPQRQQIKEILKKCRQQKLVKIGEREGQKNGGNEPKR